MFLASPDMATDSPLTQFAILSSAAGSPSSAPRPTVSRRAAAVEHHEINFIRTPLFHALQNQTGRGVKGKDRRLGKGQQTVRFRLQPMAAICLWPSIMKSR